MIPRTLLVVAAVLGCTSASTAVAVATLQLQPARDTLAHVGDARVGPTTTTSRAYDASVTHDSATTHDVVIAHDAPTLDVPTDAPAPLDVAVDRATPLETMLDAPTLEATADAPPRHSGLSNSLVKRGAVSEVRA